MIEPADYCYENAKRLSENYNKVTCYQGLFEDVADRIQGSKCDIIICSSLLHEVEDPRQLLRAIKAVCDKNSIVHVNVPNALSFHRLLAKEMGVIENIYQLSNSNLVLQQNNVFDMERLKRLVLDEGYQVINSGSYFVKPFTHKQMQQCMDMHILNEKMLEGLDQLCKTYFTEYGSEIYLNARMR